MKKNNICNSSDTMIDEMIEGYISSTGGAFSRVSGTKSIVYNPAKNEERVKIIVGGGAGCEPIYLGCAGAGMADAVVNGNVFAAPSAIAVLKTVQHMNCSAGVVFISGNYTGDVLNYELAAELCGAEGVNAKAFFVRDDILHKDKKNREARRGITGIIWTIRIASAMAKDGKSVDEILAAMNVVNENLATVSVTFWPGYRPDTGRPLYEMDEDIIEFGMGVNGEPGIKQMKMPSSEVLAKEIMDYINKDLELGQKDQISLMINGKGATSYAELYVFTNNVKEYIKRKGIHIYHIEVGNYFTAPGMGGVSVTVLKVNDLLKDCLGRGTYTGMYSSKIGAWEEK